MNCRDIQDDLPFWGDADLSESSERAIESHLASCPVCRERHGANLELRSALGSLRREAPRGEFTRALSYRLREEIGGGDRGVSWLSTDAGEWFQRRVMPYAVGAMVTLLVGFVTLTSMLNGLRDDVTQTIGATVERNATSSIMLASNRNPFDTDAVPMSAAEYAILRRDVSTDSPSLNPTGSLISLSSSFVKRSDARREDGVVVVADVLSNGIARIQEVVDPEKNRHVLRDLEKAFEAELGDAPFVPARMDNRSDYVRVVLRFQSVDVPTDGTRSSRR